MCTHGYGSIYVSPLHLPCASPAPPLCPTLDLDAPQPFIDEQRSSQLEQCERNQATLAHLRRMRDAHRSGDASMLPPAGGKAWSLTEAQVCN